MKHVFTLILVLAISLSSCGKAVLTTYVSPTETRAGVAPPVTLTVTPTQVGLMIVSPGESIQAKCINLAKSGDICEVSSGTYPESVVINKSISLVCRGTCIVYGGFNITANHVTLRGFEVTGQGIAVKGQYNLIENNYVHDLSMVTNGGISLYNQSTSHHITIKKNTIKNVYNSCIYVAGSNQLIEGNDCSYTKQPATGGDADCIRAFGFNQTIRGNYCHDIAYGPPGYNPSLGDYIDSAHIDGIQTWHFASQGGALRDSLIENNIIDLPSQGTEATAKGFQLAGVTGGNQTIDLTQDYPCRNITFKNNLVHSNLLAIFRYCQNITILNNTFIGDDIDSSAGIHILTSKGVNRIQYNIFCCQQQDAAFTPYDVESKVSLVGGYNDIYQMNGVPVGSPWPGDLWDVDPLFVNPAAGDYHLRPGSPACGMGAFPC